MKLQPKLFIQVHHITRVNVLTLIPSPLPLPMKRLGKGSVRKS